MDSVQALPAYVCHSIGCVPTSVFRSIYLSDCLQSMYAGICLGAWQVSSFIVCTDKSVSYLPEAPQILFNFPDSRDPSPFLTLEHGPHTGLTFWMCVLVWWMNHICARTCRNLRSAPYVSPMPPMTTLHHCFLRHAFSWSLIYWDMVAKSSRNLPVSIQS